MEECQNLFGSTHIKRYTKIGGIGTFLPINSSILLPRVKKVCFKSQKWLGYEGVIFEGILYENTTYFYIRNFSKLTPIPSKEPFWGISEWKTVLSISLWAKYRGVSPGFGLQSCSVRLLYFAHGWSASPCKIREIYSNNFWNLVMLRISLIKSVCL